LRHAACHPERNDGLVFQEKALYLLPQALLRIEILQNQVAQALTGTEIRIWEIHAGAIFPYFYTSVPRCIKSAVCGNCPQKSTAYAEFRDSVFYNLHQIWS
jgi:hypothetical protein